jgi:hypothetical protein
MIRKKENVSLCQPVVNCFIKRLTPALDDNGNDNSIHVFIYLFTCLINSPTADYRTSTSNDTNKTNTHTKAKQGNVHNLDSNHSGDVVTV